MCATYGAGLSTACVVDVGEEKTHICCVEDGMSNINTRHVHTHTHTCLTRKISGYCLICEEAKVI